MSVSFIKDDGPARGLSGRFADGITEDVFQAFTHLAARQAEMSKTQLIEWQAQLLGPRGLMLNFSRQVARLGVQAPELEDILELEDCDHIEAAEKAVDFVLGQHKRRKACENPFTGKIRELLCCVVFDDVGLYTLAERYAASEALRQRDALFFFRLIATTRHTVERRIVFRGLLEHFDGLLPIEQSIYPLNYRRAQQSHLDREEALYGKLELDKPIYALLEEHSPEWLLENLCPVQQPID